MPADAAAPMTLALAGDDPGELAAWARIDFPGAGFEPVVVHLADEPPELPPGLARRPVPRRDAADPVVRPDVEALVEALAGADACLLAGRSLWLELVRLFARALGKPVFRMVDDADQLSAGPAPGGGAAGEYLLIATEQVLAEAMKDPRYGISLLPVGRPVVGTGPGDDDDVGSGFGVDPAAANRLLRILERWHRGLLDPAPELSIIVPSFNEEGNVEMVCRRLLAATADLPVEVLIVDDHSDDDTYAKAVGQMWESSRIRAVRKPLPRGMGNAIRHGLGLARAPYVAVTMGDGSDEVERLPEMLSIVREGGYGLAIGSRYRHRVNYASVPRIYRFWSACFRWVTRIFIGFRLSDYTNAFRVFDRRIFEAYGPESGGFEISPEITFKAWFATRRVAEVDVRHLKRASGQSSFSFLRAGPGYGKILFKAWVQRLTGRWFVLDW